jgi:3-dehydroquinate synthetase
VRLIASAGPLPPLPRFEPERAYRQMFADKKKRDHTLRFVLPRRIGRVEVVEDIPRAAVLRVLRELPRGVSTR